MNLLTLSESKIEKDSIICEDCSSAIIVEDGKKLIVTGSTAEESSGTTVTGTIIVKEGGFLEIQESATVACIRVEGGKVLLRGHCFYLYQDGGEIDIIGGTVVIMQDEMMSTSDAVIHTRLRDANVEIFRASSIRSTYTVSHDTYIGRLEIYGNIYMHLHEGVTIENGFVQSCGTLILYGNVEISSDLKIEQGTKIVKKDKYDPFDSDLTNDRYHNVSCIKVDEDNKVKSKVVKRKHKAVKLNNIS